ALAKRSARRPPPPSEEVGGRCRARGLRGRPPGQQLCGKEAFSMLKNGLIACALVAGLAIPARAETKRLPDEVIGYTAPHRSAGGVIVGDAVGGALVGGLVGGGVAAYRNYVDNNGWGNWQRDVLVGAGIGLGVGLIIGVADAASTADRTNFGPVADRHDSGF